MIKNLIFDFGGVLTTVNTPRAVEKFKELGLQNPEQYLNAYQQLGIFHQLEAGEIDTDEFIKELSILCNRTISYDEAKAGWLAFMVNVQTDFLNFLQPLRPRYNLCILSNTNAFIQSWARSADFTPEGKPLDYYFDNLYLSYQMKCIKPNEDIFEKMLIQGNNMLAHESLFIDDGVKNIETARNMGFKVLLAENGKDWRPALQQIISE